MAITFHLNSISDLIASHTMTVCAYSPGTGITTIFGLLAISEGLSSTPSAGREIEMLIVKDRGQDGSQFDRLMPEGEAKDLLSEMVFKTTLDFADIPSHLLSLEDRIKEDTILLVDTIYFKDISNESILELLIDIFEQKSVTSILGVRLSSNKKVAASQIDALKDCCPNMILAEGHFDDGTHIITLTALKQRYGPKSSGCFQVRYSGEPGDMRPSDVTRLAAAPQTQSSRPHRAEAAKTSVRSALETSSGSPIAHADLVTVAERTGISNRLARVTVKGVIAEYGTRISTEELLKPGSPKVHTLATSADPTELPDDVHD